MKKNNYKIDYQIAIQNLIFDKRRENIAVFMGTLEIIKVANLSVIVGSAFHLLGLGILYLVGRMGFIAVALLTFATEVVVFAIRVCAALKRLGKRRL